MRVSFRVLWRKLRQCSGKPGEPRVTSRLSPPEKRRGSLRLRLSLFFAILLIFAWGVAALFAWHESRDYIDEFFDTQQLLFAQRLAASPDLHSLEGAAAPAVPVLTSQRKATRGKYDDDALAFAVYTAEGELVASDGDKGRRFVFRPGARGFTKSHIVGDNEPWRILWQQTEDGGHIIAVGQELEWRVDMALDLLAEQILPWIVLVPVLLAGLILLLTRELAPLREVAVRLQARNPGDADLLDPMSIPSEARPLVEALNNLFLRTNAMFERERAFISDAAHELRTPLAGLRIQAQVAAKPETVPEIRREALGNMLSGIDRSTRLVEQLLALSRLEALTESPEPGHGAWGGLIPAPPSTGPR